MTFQDRNWTARPWVIEEEDLELGPDWFTMRLQARGTFDAREFTWHGHFTGDASGRVEVRFEGSTTSAFLRNRLGLCILHPPSASGDPVIVEHVDGSLESTAFPVAISPDQPFVQMRALTHRLPTGLQSTIRMEGEVFESEDHRNWSDASFKHYCTPITLPFPVLVEPGEQVAQSMTLTVAGPVLPHSRPEQVEITIDEGWLAKPSLGVQMDADGHRLTDQEIALLADLRLAHVRIDLGAGDGPQRLESLLQDAEAIGAPAVVALVGADAGALGEFRDDPRIDHWLAFDPQAKVTDPALVEQVRAILGPKVGGGTDLYFTELNRGRPAGPEVIAFSVNPQVHACDDQSVMQNAMTFGIIARNARMLYPDASLEISPITLRPRFNPNATAPELDHSNTNLPAAVDARQCQPFAAAWTALTFKAIAESGCIDAVTYYRATGWEGLIERAEGSPAPADFASVAGEPFEVYWVLRALADAQGVLPCSSSDPDRVDALALDSGLVLVANLTAQPQRAIVGGQQVLVPAHGLATVQLESGSPTSVQDPSRRRPSDEQAADEQAADEHATDEH